jgi:hypothetical protein
MSTPQVQKPRLPVTISTIAFVETAGELEAIPELIAVGNRLQPPVPPPRILL